MSDQIKDGGPAFPGDDGWTDRGTHYHGMSLRDWFAGMALQGAMPSYRRGDCEVDMQALAKTCYKFADAFLEERK